MDPPIVQRPFGVDQTFAAGGSMRDCRHISHSSGNYLSCEYSLYSVFLEQIAESYLVVDASSLAAKRYDGP